MMRLPAFALAAAAALAGTAAAAKPQTQVMSVPLPDGSVARVEYVGDVPPKVTVEPRPGLWAGALPPLADFDRMFEQMRRQMREIERMARQPIAGARGVMNVASQGSLPAGTSSVSVVSVSNGGRACTRTTEMVSQGPGKPPRVTTSLSGNCAPERQAPPAGAPPTLDQT